jgi:vacuolar-type H+-ATPase subunit F/Vma7
MTYIVERLRNVMHETKILQMCEEAADEIERLRAENKALKDGPRHIPIQSANEDITTQLERHIRKAMRKP